MKAGTNEHPDVKMGYASFWLGLAVTFVLLAFEHRGIISPPELVLSVAVYLLAKRHYFVVADLKRRVGELEKHMADQSIQPR
jgi:hypothetical protein